MGELLQLLLQLKDNGLQLIDLLLAVNHTLNFYLIHSLLALVVFPDLLEFGVELGYHDVELLDVLLL